MKPISLSLPLLFLIVFNSSSQQISKSKEVSVDKWVHAVINIQCIPSMSKQEDVIWIQLRKHQITNEQFQKKLDSINSCTIQSSLYGTAIYLLYKKHHYLLTARHVLNEPTEGDNAIFSKIILVNDTNHRSNTHIINRNNDMAGERQPLLMLYEYYILSPFDDDIGIICLDGETEGYFFWETLDKRGYIPISIDDIDAKCKIKSNQKFFCIGYPKESFVQQKLLPIAAFYWESYLISVPIMTNGVIEDPFKSKNYFYGNIFVYHGFSGGPAIVNNKLVGIVHRSETEELNSGTVHYHLFHFKFMKSSLVEPLLKKIEFDIFKD